MTKYILEYAQPRPADYDKGVAIFEKKTKTLKREDIKNFLREGHVICSGVVHHRFQISLREKPSTPKTIVEPHPEFLALGDEFPER